MGEERGRGERREDHESARRREEALHTERANLVHQLWGRFDDELRRVLSLGYDLARREGKTRISTRTFLAAVAQIWPTALQPLLRTLPEGALPRIPVREVHMRSDITRETPELSTCLESTLRELSRAAGPERRITITDVFVDLLKHGTGDSVVDLRARGVTAAWLDAQIRKLELRLLSRAGRERHERRGD
jgi:hypothetical protein